MKFLSRAMVSLAASAVLTFSAAAADRAIIVLDASGSMWGQIGGKAKLEIARETLKDVLTTIPGDLELGLMAYGHRQKGSCEDIELVVPPGPGTSAAISQAADKMKFLGKTPLSAAVRKAAEDLKYTEDKATVILITDGIETCNADPCAVGRELEQSGVDFTAHVVGFGLSEEEGKQVACLAENTGGKYLPASDASALKDALKVTVAAAPEPAPAPKPEPAAPAFNLDPSVTLMEGGPEFGKGDDVTWLLHKVGAMGDKGEYVATEYGGDWKGNFSPGEYLLSATRDYATVEQKVTIEAGKAATPHFVLNGGKLVLRAKITPDGDVVDGAAIDIKLPEGRGTTGYGKVDAVFPAGDREITVRIGKGEVTETLALKAGETIDKDIIVGVGRLVVNAFYVPGMKVDAGGLAVNIFKAKKSIDGQREDMGYGYGPDSSYDLPPGEYAAVVRLDEAGAEGTATVSVNEATNVDVVLNAGVVSVSAPGAKTIEIFGAAKDIEGKRKPFGHHYAETVQTTLTAGDYVVVATRGDDNVATEAPVSVKAGERTEVAVP